MDPNALIYIHASKDGLANENRGVQSSFKHQNSEIPSHVIPSNHPLHPKGPPTVTVAAISTSSSSEELEDGLYLVSDEGEAQLKEDTPTEASNDDTDSITACNEATKKWYFQSCYLVTFALATCCIIAIPVILSSRNATSTSAPSPEQIACNFISISKLIECRSTYAVSRRRSISGTIPSEIGLLTQLTSLDLASNQLTGTISSTVSNLSNLKRFYIGNNALKGTIPSTLSNLSQLVAMGFSFNQLTGTIPSSISNLAHLEYLFLNNNQFNGTIPSFISNLSHLQIVSISANQLTGAIPSYLSRLLQLEYLHLSNNHLTGTIPFSISNLSNLRGMYLDNNQLNGTIPLSFSNLLSLQYLYAEHNQLTGTIPSSFCTSPNHQLIRIDCGEITCDPGCCHDRNLNSCD
ncbi:hypothetical protein MHU86_1364 [Fragilaria crotonensis]|nr:hypothetical protein MHU86_1364 [Fragilaria crotonensis]